MIQRGVIVFSGITIIAFTAIFLYNNTGNSIQALKNIKIEYFLIMLLLVFFDWWLGAYRNHIFVKKVVSDVSISVTFIANLANIFMGAVTPSQTGGGPMHLYMLYRGGVKLTDGVVISIINFISTIIFLVASAGISLYYLRDKEISDGLYLLIQSGFSIFTTLFLLIFIGLIAPAWISKVLVKLGQFLTKINVGHKDKIDQMIKTTSEKLFEYNSTIFLFVKKHPVLFPKSIFYTILLYFNKYLIAYFIVIGLGYSVDFWTVIAIHAIITFLLYFAPSPGASGIAEVSISFLMGQIMLSSGLASFTILQRFFTLMLPAALGAFFVLRELKRHSRE